MFNINLIRKLEIQITMNYHLPVPKMAIKQIKYPKKASVGEYIEKLESSYIPGGNVKLTLQKTWYFLKKLNLQLTI